MTTHLLAASALLLAGPQPWWLGPLAILFLIAFAGVGYLLWYRRRRLDKDDTDEGDDASLPPLIFPPRPASPVTQAPPPSDKPRARAESADRSDDDAAKPDPDAPGISDSVRIAPTPIRFSLMGAEAQPTTRSKAAPTPDSVESPAPAAERRVAGPLDAAEASPADNDPDSSIHPSTHPPIHDISAGAVRFHRVPEGTLQLLPGRLEVLDDASGVHEIRFVRPAASEPVITFGRAPGEPLKHVQLDAPTVSRMHARMVFLDREWRIVNLSGTNPVIVNGVRLNGDSSTDGKLLEDGDVVEMGEVSFRFRMP